MYVGLGGKGKRDGRKKREKEKKLRTLYVITKIGTGMDTRLCLNK